MPRAIYAAQVNLPADLTDLLRLFIIFWSYEHVEIFIRITNKYVEKKIEFKRKKHSSFFNYSRYINWKPLIIKEIYIFLGILILMSSDWRLKIKDY